MMFRSLLFLPALILSCQGEDILNSNGGFGGMGGAGGMGMGGGGMSNPYGAQGGGFGGQAGQGDGMFSALGDYGASMAMLLFGQCLETINMDEMQRNPFKAMDARCSPTQKVDFNKALEEFDTCSGFNLKAIIENIFSIYVGLAFNCGEYILENEATFMSLMMSPQTSSTPLPRVPDICVDALVGDNPLGNAILNFNQFPEKEVACFHDLAGSVPRCTLNEWPIPIVGSWLKAISCIYGSFGDTMNDQCQAGLESLATCLPDDIDESKCNGYAQACAFGSTEAEPAYFMAFPPPFWGPPITDKCKAAAENAGDNKDLLQGAVQKYEKYRNVCIPAKDKAIYEVKQSSGEASSSSSSSSSSAAARGSSSSSDEKDIPLSTESALQKVSGDSSKFIPGLISGMVVAFAAVLVISKIRGLRKNQIMSSYTDDLELTESTKMEFA